MTGFPRIWPTPVRVRDGSRTVGFEQIALGGIPRGAIIVVTTRSGHDTVELQNELAASGYESIVARLGPEQFAGAGHDVALIEAGVALLAQRQWTSEQIGVVSCGPCGWLALQAAHRLELGAAVSFAPVLDGAFHADGGGVLEAVSGLRCAWLGLFAGHARAVAHLDEQFQALPIAHDGNAYARAVAFADVRPAFYEGGGDAASNEASFEGWQRTLEWFNLRVVPRSTPCELLPVHRNHAACDAGRTEDGEE